MTSALVIGDIHSKAEIYDAADRVIDELKPTKILLLGDLEDDFIRFDVSCEEYARVQERGLDRCIQFCRDHTGDILICYGNHDVSYLDAHHTDGYDRLNEDMIGSKLNEIMKLADCRTAHRLGKCLFSHAAITMEYIKYLGLSGNEGTDVIVDKVNGSSCEDLTQRSSPIWHRILWNPQKKLYGETNGFWHFIGHSPVRYVQECRNAVLCDTFSRHPTTYKPYGTQEFIYIDDVNRPMEYRRVTSALKGE